MKKVIILAVVFSLLISVMPAYAKNPGDKLKRGLANVCGSFILEIPKTMGEEWEQSNNAALGCTTGFFKGIFRSVARMGSGLWDVLTFPISIPGDYEPIFDPDYVYGPDDPEKE